MLGGRVIEIERDYRGTRTTEVVLAESAKIMLDMGNGARIEIPLNRQLLITTLIEDGSSWQDPFGCTMRNPDRISLDKIEVRPEYGNTMFNLFWDTPEAVMPHDEMCGCGNHG